MRSTAKRLFLVITMALFSGLWIAGPAQSSQTIELPDGSKIDLSIPCPVCEMKITPGPNSPAAIVFSDGTVVGFDANSDFFKYLLDPEKYKHSSKTIKSIFVKAADTKNFVDAKQAFFVVVSGSSGEMGFEVTAFSGKPEAEKHLQASQGARLFAFSEITLAELQPKKKLLKMKESSQPSKPAGSHGGH
mgnify:FL=1